jgi:hypothetical protein
MLTQQEKDAVRRVIKLAYRQWLAENFDRVCELPVSVRWSVIRQEAAGKLHGTKMRKRAAFEIEEA